MKRKPTFIEATCILPLVAFLLLIGCSEEQAPLDQAAIKNGESLVLRNSLQDFLPVGTNPATFYTWPIRELGKGVVEVANNAGATIVKVKDHRGNIYGFELAADLTSCEFEGAALPPAQAAFERVDGGALGSRVDREWKNSRLTVLVGRSLQDNQNVIYLNDRLTNDILVITKFPIRESQAEQDGAEQPTTALESKSEGNVNTNPESEVRSQ